MSLMSDIDKKVFVSPYVKFAEGEQHDMVLRKPRTEKKTFDGKEKAVISFSVAKLDGEEFPPGAKEWSTGSYALFAELVAILERADGLGLDAIAVRVKRGPKNQYTIMDLTPYPKFNYVGVKA